MPSIAFIDTEIDVKSKKILDIGCITGDGKEFHQPSPSSFFNFVKNIDFLCGHNILNHDLPFLAKNYPNGITKPAIDTLYLSPLLFPKTPYHALVKDDKINPDGPNNPFNDAKKAQELFYQELAAFEKLSNGVKDLFYLLLNATPQFSAFFAYVGYSPSELRNRADLILDVADSKVCSNVEFDKLIKQYPIELAYCLSLILADDDYSITPPWILRSFPAVDQVMKMLRNKPCTAGCPYCAEKLDAVLALKRIFGFDKFRVYDGEPLQEMAVKAAIAGRSILTVFPTGGGKSITFQLPALIAGETSKALTVVISPLQSLMKDQVDNLERQDITESVTINGLLDPIERANSFERVASGRAWLLYISPESLRSPSIINLLAGRKIARFVIDEAHCFSSWGQDFRVDYLYIGDFIRELEQKKNLSEPIPVSCFTATAKRKVIEDIQEYFKTKNELNLELYTSTASRSNLTYTVLEKNDDDEKYSALRDLIADKNCPTIVYVSRTHRAEVLAEKLTIDGLNAKAYHGKMDKKEKSANQDVFIKGDIQVMVATSAFGMGVDKKDIGMVIHYEISDSLENYVQEAGRAGRDERISAACYVLFNEDDLGKHFILLNQTKLSIKEIQQVWKAVKEITKYRTAVSNSSLEIARKAGWDDNVREIETRVTTAIAALEEAKYLKRGQNMPQVFATSILVKTAQEAIHKINLSERMDPQQKEQAARIMKKLISSKRRKESSDEVAESRVDYISDHLGIVKSEVIGVINSLREEHILADQKDLSAYIKKGESSKGSLSLLEQMGQIERRLLANFSVIELPYNLKDLNEDLEAAGCKKATPINIKTIINFLAIKNWIKRRFHDYSRNTMTISCTEAKEVLVTKMERRHELSRFIVTYLYGKIAMQSPDKEHLVEFSVHEIKRGFENSASLFGATITIDDVEDALFFLSRIDAIKIEGGFMVTYNRLRLERLEQNNQIQYKKEDYRKLNQFYESRVQQIHIVGEYAKQMVRDKDKAQRFVADYFNLNFTAFLNQYFPGTRQLEIKRNITLKKFRELFGSLSPKQLEIINDSESRYILVAAGPGSGKTKVLVHKLASLALMEDVRTDQMLMIAFSRAAVSEFKRKLTVLLGGGANYIEIKTFHSYCFDLLGRIGTLEKSENVIKDAIEKIQSGEVEQSRITKTVLVIDEAQDMDNDEFELVRALIEQNDEMRVIAVGDDDQNIFAFRKADSKYMRSLVLDRQGKVYELTENYRSAPQLVEFSNLFVGKIRNRIKSTPITSNHANPGSVKLTKYQAQYLYQPLVNDIVAGGRTGTVSVLTRTNEEASVIVELLIKHGRTARLIQSNEGFNLYNLYEARYFIDALRVGDSPIIDEENWDAAKKHCEKVLKPSNKLFILKKIIAEFESSFPGKKFKSDLEIFIKESKLEDFYSETGEVILVSTIHKSKGREFDNVYLMLRGAPTGTDEEMRPLYVAITRAKRFLSIHTNGNEFDGIDSAGLTRLEDNNQYGAPSEFKIQLTLKDVILDFFISRQHLYFSLASGDALLTKQFGCCNGVGVDIVRCSQKFKDQIVDFERKGYRMVSAVVNFIVYWRKEGSEVEFKVILPEILFARSRD